MGVHVIDTREVEISHQFESYRRSRAAAEFGIAELRSAGPARGHLALSTTWSGYRDVIRYAEVDDPHVVRVAPVRAGGAVVALNVCSAALTTCADGVRVSHAPGSLALTVFHDELEVDVPERCSLATVRVERDELYVRDQLITAAVAGDLSWLGWHADFVLAQARAITGIAVDPLAAPAPAGLDRHVAAIVELLLRSASGLGGAGLPSARRLRRDYAEQFVQRHLLDPTLTAATIASYLGISTRQLARDLDGGPSATEMIQAARLQHADQLLRDPANSEMMLAQIARTCRFSSQAHFSRAYREHFGTTPREARAQSARQREL